MQEQALTMPNFEKSGFSATLLVHSTCVWVLGAGWLASAQPQVAATHTATLLDQRIGAARLAHPLGLSVDMNANLFIADTGNNRLLKFSMVTGKFRETGGFGFRDEEFDRPVDVWAANGLDVWVADYNNRRIKRYDKDLNFVAAFVSDPAYDSSLQFGYPAAVTVSLNGELFLADHEFNRVLRFDIFGAPVASFADFSWGEGQLEHPAKLLTAANGDIWASDSLQHALLHYDAYGNFLGRIGKNLLTQPAGLAEWRDCLLVADSRMHRVLMIDSQGERVADFGTPGHGPADLFTPTDLAVVRTQKRAGKDDQATIAVLDAGNNRVQVFTLNWHAAE